MSDAINQPFPCVAICKQMVARSDVMNSLLRKGIEAYTANYISVPILQLNPKSFA